MRRGLLWVRTIVSSAFWESYFFTGVYGANVRVSGQFISQDESGIWDDFVGSSSHVSPPEYRIDCKYARKLPEEEAMRGHKGFPAAFLLRFLCQSQDIQNYFKTKEKQLEDGVDTFKPNYLAIFDTLKDCTSETFCVAQVLHLVETILEELTDVEPQNNSMEHLMSNRKPLLSVILRLRATAKVFNDGPGGSMAATMYEKEFTRFHALEEGDCGTTRRESARTRITHPSYLHIHLAKWCMT